MVALPEPVEIPGGEPMPGTDVGPSVGEVIDNVEKIGTYRGQFPRPSQLVPLAGRGLQATWDDVWGWAQDTADAIRGDMPGVSYVTIDDVVNISRAYAGQAVKALSGFIDDAAAVGFGALDTTATYVATFTPAYISALVGIYNDIGLLGRDIATIQDAEIPAILHEIARVSSTIVPTVEYGVGATKAWAVDNIFRPLTDELGAVAANLHAEIDRGVRAAEDHASALVHNEALTRAAEVGALTAAVKALQTFNDDCGEPMCETVGPKTDVGKALKGLGALLGLGAGAAILGLTESDLERIASAFGHISSGSLDGFLSGFVSGGESLGTAGAGLISDTGHIATTVLADLGIPGL